MTKISFASVCAFVSCASLCFLAHASPVAVRSKGETVVASTLGEAPVEVTIRTHEVPNGSPAKPVKPKGFVCTMSHFPCSAVDEIVIKIDGIPVSIPRRVYARFSDLTSAELVSLKGKKTLVLEGGDAAESYAVKIEFNSKCVTRRLVSLGEFPDEPPTVTSYACPFE